VIELIERECARFGVPGAAVTAVAGGEVALAEGFGCRNGTDPVTSRTLFMLASDTKCFAAATLCLLAEEGLLDLDRPVRDYVPWFGMHDDRVSGWVTSRDLLAHRTGLPRHELMTVGNGGFRISNEDVARRMRHLEASRPFRQGFSYSNANYAAAGHVAEVVSGQPWRDLVADRLLGPLQMAGSTTYSPQLTCGDFAAPHVNGSRLPFQTRDYDLPSGGLVSHAEDIGRWLLARLGHGPISPGVLDVLHTPTVVADESLPFRELHSMGYALGNLVFAYRGHRLHLHGGSQVGFASQVLVLPDAQLGVAVLTNTYGSKLPMALGLTLVDHLLGLEPLPWGSRLAASPPQPPAPTSPGGPLPRDLSDYCGTFHHPAYGDLTLKANEATLTASFHGLDDELVMTHVEGDEWRLTYLTLPGFSFPVSFVPGRDRRIADVALGIEPELAPLVFARR
jgi:CubicO group peptidase (beta-lactamase class C family)